MVNKLYKKYVFNITEGKKMTRKRKIGLLGLAGVTIMAGFAILTDAVGLKGGGMVILYTIAVGGIGYAIARSRCGC